VLKNMTTAETTDLVAEAKGELEPDNQPGNHAGIEGSTARAAAAGREGSREKPLSMAQEQPASSRRRSGRFGTIVIRQFRPRFRD
jgi:hypothetical protein